MIEIHDMERGSGKTTKVIELMNEDLNQILIVPYKKMTKFYPRNLRNRIFTIAETRGIKLNKVILDEGFLYNKKDLAEMYYYFGKYNVDVISYGTSLQQ
ncbi:hypothetical protein MHB54_01100 [Paenibacillus sp. FSL M7-0802]|uniref:hypothetical protein n=1 Tax=Paenibacillus sp. FSL M7-0802 TaxID=2921536 RepID=UPI0030F4C834